MLSCASNGIANADQFDCELFVWVLARHFSSKLRGH